jgi:sterol desaturase/sphingolipid hydroxylase (fatty acid hydroxylase superfamily)
MMVYWHWLLGISLAFAALERLRPARPAQPALRPQLANDLFYLAFHGYFYAALTGAWVGAVAVWARGALGGVLPFAGEASALARLPFAAQFALYLVVSDFLQWCVHNLLHRVPALWAFHKVHHSVQRMDWAGNFRFHWVEVVVYRSLLYVPLALLGGSPEPLFAVAVFATAWGHFNHANLDVGLGPLGYVMNSPRMHLWHHDASSEGGPSKNFGVVLSAWDFLFGTAFWPRDRAPARIGYPGDAEMPSDVPRQLAFPLTRHLRVGHRRPARRPTR